MSVDDYYDSLSTESKISLLRSALDDYAKFSSCLIREMRLFNISRKDTISEYEGYGFLLFQEATIKICTLTNLSMGVNLYVQGCRRDITSLYSVLRSLIELIFIFHNIYVTQDSLKEKEIVFSLWIIHGLLNRQKINAESEEQKEQQMQEKNQIESEKSKIKQALSTMTLSASAMKDVDRILKKRDVSIVGYHFIKDADDNVISIKEIYPSAIESEISHLNWGNLMYRQCCFHSHPSFLGLLQFKDMYTNKNDAEFLKEILSFALNLYFAAIYIFCKSNSRAKQLAENINYDLITGVFKHIESDIANTNKSDIV